MIHLAIQDVNVSLRTPKHPTRNTPPGSRRQIAGKQARRGHTNVSIKYLVAESREGNNTPAFSSLLVAVERFPLLLHEAFAGLSAAVYCDVQVAWGEGVYTLLESSDRICAIADERGG